MFKIWDIKIGDKVRLISKKDEWTRRGNLKLNKIYVITRVYNYSGGDGIDVEIEGDEKSFTYLLSEFQIVNCKCPIMEKKCICGSKG